LKIKDAHWYIVKECDATLPDGVKQTGMLSKQLMPVKKNHLRNPDFGDTMKNKCQDNNKKISDLQRTKSK
jgi:hypothetical protein